MAEPPAPGERKKALVVLIALVVAVDAAAIAIYLLTGIRRAGPTAQFLFTIVWTAVTVAVVIRGIRRVLGR